jgi:Protein of unknown function (DUF3040)
MALRSEELLTLHTVADDMRRGDPRLHRALVTGKPPRSRWSLWCTIHVAGSVLMLILGALAGVSMESIVLWLALVTAGTAAIRGQDRADIKR